MAVVRLVDRGELGADIDHDTPPEQLISTSSRR
jgi:hypothetical protein